MKKIDCSGEKPIAEGRHKIVVIAFCRLKVARANHEVKTFAHLVNKGRDCIWWRIAIRTESNYQVSFDQRQNFEICKANPFALLDKQSIIVFKCPLNRSIGRATIDDNNLITPLLLDLGHNDFHAFNFVEG